MRPYTIAFSIVAHAIAVCAAIIAPLLATDELPAPRTATEFVQVVPVAPPPPPPAPRTTTLPPTTPPRADAAPLSVPDGIAPETFIEPVNDAPPVDGSIISFGNCTDCDIGDPVPPPPPPPPPPPSIRHVGGDIKPPQKVVDVAPVYPPLARAARVEGIVILEAVIAEDGSVRDVRVLRSVQLLDDAAAEAVRQWRFTPTLLNGQPVPVVMTITVAFKLR
ncbi:MAG TPA: energy transducer TonB [Vicinamibacterales bacterium]|jgi:protein TonB